MKVVLFIFYSFVTLYFIVRAKGEDNTSWSYMFGVCISSMLWPIITVWTLLDMIFEKNDTSMKF
jgi:hypothetical protein